jgi:gamma-glutamylcyclotransferase
MEPVWYFAYGSNMQTATFGGRRGITPVSAHTARAPGWRLVLDKPPLLGPAPGFANLVPDAGAAVFGVVYEISADDMAHVELTEGVAIDNYRRTKIDVVPLAAVPAPSRAFTLVSDKRTPDLRPSARYMALLIDGAEEHGLPDEWITMLRAVPTVAESAEAAAARALLDDALDKVRRARSGTT